MKALLEEQGQHVPRTHDFASLVERISKLVTSLTRLDKQQHSFVASV
ncbi:hypothetical protein [Alicyclobacillus fodiniaquatilis]|uniref:HEPN domain-containing protein n=1 Tax=Alicyclobacillus fodiniaquatilis TaxID=1661150 RepID=A0ABW4JGC0_9BACL